VSIVGGMDVHRGQLTYDYVDEVTGEVERGRVPGTRRELAGFLARFEGAEGVRFAIEACTGWRYVAEEMAAHGIEVHLAETADTAALKSRKKRAKTDRNDARHLRDLLRDGRLPEAWLAPAHVLDARALVRLYVDLVNQRVTWRRRAQAVLFHHGFPAAGDLRWMVHRQRLEETMLDLPAAGQRSLMVALQMSDAVDAQIEPIAKELERFSQRQLGCRALQTLFGVGPVTSVAIWAELGDCRRFSSSGQAVRHSGLDITVYSSDQHRAPGHLAKQGPSVLRWALFEAAKNAAKSSSPDHAYYCQAKTRVGSGRATLSVARKLVRRCHHILVSLGDAAMQPVS
jgi:transposase